MNQEPKIIGHRGAAGLISENTLESIQKALDCDVDGVEIDVHRCASGELVVIHDETVDRTTNGIGKVNKMTLRQLKVLEVHGGYRIPTLDEVLELIHGKCMLNIELKGKKTAKGTVAAIEHSLKQKLWTNEHFIVSSFDWEQLRMVRKLNKTIRIGILKEGKLKKAFKIANKLKAYSIHPDYVYLRRYHMWRARRRKIVIYPWTVNEDKAIQKMKDYKVTGIITDFPDRYAAV